MEEQGNDYLLELERLMSSDVAKTYWSHNMDLLVIVTFDNLLELYRISFKAQKVFQVEEDKDVVAVSFSPDSQFLAYGLIDGEVKVLKTQNGENLLSVSNPISEQITSFNFVEFGAYSIRKILPFKQDKMLEKLILPISPHKNCNKYLCLAAIIKLNYFNHLPEEKTQFTLLLSSSEKHSSLYLNGFIPIAQINYDSIAANHSIENYKIHHTSLDERQNIESVLVEQKSDRYVLFHAQFDSKVLQKQHTQNDVIRFNCLISYLSEILTYVEMAYPAAELYLRDIMRQYNSKMNLIDFADPTEAEVTVNPCEELFKHLNFGVTSDPLIHFLTKEVYDSKVLQKLDETLNSIFNSLHDLILESIQNSLERAYLLAYELKNLSSLINFSLFGVTEQDIDGILSQIEKLYTMGEILLVESTEAKFDIRNLLVWLNKATIKSQPDTGHSIQNANSYLSRYTVDFARLHKFLESQHTFKLQHLAWFFGKTNESRSLKIPECDFRLLTKGNDNRLRSQNPEVYAKNTRQIEEMLGLTDILLPEETEKMQVEMNYQSFKLQMKALNGNWKEIKIKPILSVSKSIEKSCKITKIGEVMASELYDFELRSLNKKTQNGAQLLHYFIERPSATSDEPELIVEYSTLTKQRRHICVGPPLHVLSISVAQDIIVLLENQKSMQEEKFVGEVVNSSWNGEQLQLGRKIQKLNGNVLMSAGMRGLNSIVINKNKLVVFD